MLRRQDMQLSKLYRALLFVAPVILTAPMAVMATITVNTSNDPTNTFQQTQNSPCVIGNTSCKNGGFIDTEFSGTPGGGNGSTYIAYSPSYFVAGSTAIS